MKLPHRIFLHLAAGAAALPAVSRFAWAQAYPGAPRHTKVLAAVADAVGIEPVDLWRHPDTPSADALPRDQPPEVRQLAIKVIQALLR